MMRPGEVREELVIHNAHTNDDDSAQVNHLHPGDAEDVAALQEIAVGKLERADLYAPLSKEEIVEMLDGRGRGLALRVNQQLVAFRMLYFPGEGPDNLGREVGISGDALNSVAHLEASVVDPFYRGNNLQQWMTNKLLHLLKEEGQIRHVLSTVSHLNFPSIRDKFRNGLQIVDLKPKYSGYLRYIFYRDLLADAMCWTESRSVQFDDLEAQTTLLSAGWLGYESGLKDGISFIHYGFPAAPVQREETP